MSKTVIFCFDFGSPYSYMAYKYLNVIEDKGATIEMKPVLVGAIHKATGNQSPVMIKNKGDYMFKDLNRWSNKLDVPLKMNPYFPIITIPHMRGAILAQQENILKPYMDTMFKAIWVDSLNLNDQEILSQVATDAGFDANSFSEGIMSDEIKEKLKENTQYAIDNGSFGVPTFYCNDQIYWGIDSVKFLLDDLS